jgi:outer membrane protein assembly factor BamB
MSKPATLPALLATLLFAGAALAADWSQFRGPNASGLSNERNLPAEFGPNRNVVWKTPLPAGHSSPVLSDTRVFLTAEENGKLLVFCLDRATGTILWRREAPRPRVQELHKSNHPASPSPVTDGTNVYVFFTDFGLLSYGPDGNERWRLPLGPFNNPFGQGASPILAGDKLLMICDAESGGFFVAVDKSTGRVAWRVERPDVTRGFSTPVLYQPKGGKLQALIAGAYRLTAYEVDTGTEVWFLRGLTWQIKPTPVLGQDVIFIQNWAGGADEGQQENIPSFQDTLARWDADKDGKLSPKEVPDTRITKAWREADLDDTGYLEDRDWKFYQSKRSVLNAVNAYRLGGQGDMTETNFLWRYTKSLPNVPSPLLYKDVLYMVKEGGIVTTLHPATGAVLKQGRLMGALELYFASPVGADDKVYTISEGCKAPVLKAGAEWEVLAVNDLGDESCHATPAIADGKLYIRTRSALYCFAKLE